MCSMAGRGAVRTRERVHALLREGKSVAAIARSLGLTKATVCYHRGRLGYPIDERCNRRYDWTEVQSFYDRGQSVRECQAHFGFSSKTWHVATVKVRETEYKLDPQNPKVAKAGVVSFEVVNSGKITHALEVEGPGAEVKTGAIAQGASATLKADLSKPGTYEWYCPIGDHKARGMKGTITVAGGRGRANAGASKDDSSGKSGGASGKSASDDKGKSGRASGTSGGVSGKSGGHSGKSGGDDTNESGDSSGGGVGGGY